jgi:mRNA interferase MazF
VVIKRGEIWWASLPNSLGSGPGYRRPVLVVQSNDFNRSRISTAIVAVITSNVKLALAPGNMLLPQKASKLTKESVVNISQLLTIDKSFLTERVSILSTIHIKQVDAGLKLILSLKDNL